MARVTRLTPRAVTALDAAGVRACLVAGVIAFAPGAGATPGVRHAPPAVAAQPATRAVTTFNRDVAPILFAHCTSCHRPGEAGGFSLLTYTDARPRAAAIARVVTAGLMPPWKPRPIDGLTFIGERRLAAADIATIQRWVDDGATAGDPADLPPPPRYADGWRLGTPDLVLTMRQPYTVAANGPDQLRNVVLPVPLARARYVRGLEFRPDNPRVVHHANIRVASSGSARQLDGEDGAPGFDGRLTGGADFPDGQFLGWTPGQLPPLLDADVAWRLEAHSDLVVQLHLRPSDRPEPVQVRIGLFFADDDSPGPQRMPVMLRLGRQDLDLPAGHRDYRSSDSYRLPVDVELLAIQPHAHFRARAVAASALLPSGDERPLLQIDDWDFDWQDQYRLVRPLSLPAGTQLRMTFRYDNSGGNRRNPDRPPRRIRLGQNSSDEMGDVWFQVIPARAGDRARLVADIGRKVLAEDAIGFETLLAGEPRNPRLHEAAAAIRLTLGELPAAVTHLEAALRLDPRSAEAHYNLATARAWQGRVTEAIDHLRAAIASAPTHVRAHVNLGALLRSRDPAAAERHLQQALTFDAGNAAAHANLAGLRLARGQVELAMQGYRAALEHNATLLEPLTELAWTLATSPTPRLQDPPSAVAYAERAHVLTGDSDLRVLDALAAAYAAHGRFDDAVATIGRAIRQLPATASAEDTRRRLEERRAMYQRRQPYRDDTRGGR